MRRDWPSGEGPTPIARAIALIFKSGVPLLSRPEALWTSEKIAQIHHPTTNQSSFAPDPELFICYLHCSFQLLSIRSRPPEPNPNSRLRLLLAPFSCDSLPDKTVY